MVAPLGDLGRFAQRLSVPGPERLRQEVDLAPFVVEVVLAGHLVSESVVQGGKDVPEDRLSAVPDREGPGGVRAHELDLEPPLLGPCGKEWPTAALKKLLQSAVQHLRLQEDVDEARPRHLRPAEPAPVERGREASGQLARRDPRDLRADEREVRGKVAELRPIGGGDLHGDRRKPQPFPRRGKPFPNG